jgi:ribosomal protein L39E
MSSNLGVGLPRTLPMKKRLAAAAKRADPVPAWIVARTGGEVRMSHRARHWRRSGRIKP